MKKNNIIYIVLFFVILGSSFSGDRNKTRIDRNVHQMDASTLSFYPVNTNQESCVFLPQLAAGFSTDSISVGSEILTGLSGFYDYKTNGEALVYIQVDPSNYQTIHAIDVTSDSLDATGTTTRRTKYTFSTNGGLTWESSVTVPDVRSGFGVLVLKNGAAIISNHSTNAGGRLDANLYVDVAPLAATFEEKAHPNPTSTPFGIWPQVAVFGNGNVGLISRRNVSSTNPPETLYYSWYQSGTQMNPRVPIWISGMSFNGTVGSNMRYHIATNGGAVGTIIIAPVNENDTLGASKIFQRTTTDNGVTWGPVTTVFAPYTENSGQDTIATAGGSGFTYKPNTSQWYLAYPVSADGLYSSGKLVMTKSNGSTTTICTATDVGATTTYNLAQAFVFNIDFPTLGWSADGTTLYCVYSVTKPDTGASGFNQRDLYLSYSLTDGTTWSTPLRLTSTTNIDETYPSVSSWNRGTPGGPFELNLVYMKDPGVGPASFNGTGTLAPASRNFLVYRKLTGYSPIGINNNNNTVSDYHLSQNYPNPFNPTTKIEYSLLKAGLVTIKVYDILGREVASLVNEVQTAGVKSIEFNAEKLTSGIYMYKIESGSYTDTKKMIILK